MDSVAFLASLVILVILVSAVIAVIVVYREPADIADTLVQEYQAIQDILVLAGLAVFLDLAVTAASVAPADIQVTVGLAYLVTADTQE